MIVDKTKMLGVPSGVFVCWPPKQAREPLPPPPPRRGPPLPKSGKVDPVAYAAARARGFTQEDAVALAGSLAATKYGRLSVAQRLNARPGVVEMIAVERKDIAPMVARAFVAGMEYLTRVLEAPRDDRSVTNFDRHNAMLATMKLARDMDLFRPEQKAVPFHSLLSGKIIQAEPALAEPVVESSAAQEDESCE